MTINNWGLEFLGEFTFVKGYKDNKQLRTSFNQLAEKIFGIEFETWYKHGFWTDKYQPYSYVDKGEVIANVSVNLLNLVINNKEKHAVQIGTVMTHPDYRNRGLSKKLMVRVLEDFRHVDLFYLFANQSVLDFYPKFGFKKVEEVQYSNEYTYRPTPQSGVRKLDGSKNDDLQLIYNLASNWKSISKIFGTCNNEELLMFYCLMVFPKDLYYLEAEQAIVIFQTEGNVLHLYDVVSKKKIKLEDILSRITSKNISKIVFYFHPDDNEIMLEKQTYQSSNVLFVKQLTNFSLPMEFKHPLTSQA